MIRDLPDTTATHISTALRGMRRAMGVPAVGMVLTLVIVTDEAGVDNALAAAGKTAREHPSRILAVLHAQSDSPDPTCLDAEVRICSEIGAGEAVVLRLSGEVIEHPDSVVLPLLLPDAPIVVWWPRTGPDSPSQDPVGALAHRRITDTAAAACPPTQLVRRSRTYAPGDTDLAWTRTTPWRSILAAALDRHHVPIHTAVLETDPDDPSSTLLAAWLAQRLQVRVECTATADSYPPTVRLHGDQGQITLKPTGDGMAELSTPDHPDQCVAMPHTETAELISEELRRLEPDDVYGTVLQHIQAAATSLARTSA
jgi:glucose-6-phosphate dehydrogenase assembly protein OpcA